MGKKMATVTLTIMLLTLFITSCSAEQSSTNPTKTTAKESSAKITQEQTEVTTDETSNTGEELIIRELISPEDALKRLDSDEDILLLDVRTEAEYNQVHIPGSTLIPVEELESRYQEILQWQDKPVIVYCRSGRRSAIAADILAENNFKVVYDLGGINDWPYEKTGLS